MQLSQKGLCEIEHQADKKKNVNLMFLVQILREVREIKALLEIQEKSGNCGYDSAGGADNSEN